ncbi:hypothetical protein CVT26_012265 [Gymnopilus dilepis]|uniref:Uncharacterized protein n=1 Tax=Gymnopilus dilepis TaxID=231916 RepID=A0A409YQB0_9AGAR|nr:hypothetical protein CVT26_012265 [Gymnopilus dilepis]
MAEDTDITAIRAKVKAKSKLAIARYKQVNNAWVKMRKRKIEQTDLLERRALQHRWEVARDTKKKFQAMLKGKIPLDPDAPLDDVATPPAGAQDRSGTEEPSENYDGVTDDLSNLEGPASMSSSATMKDGQEPSENYDDLTDESSDLEGPASIGSSATMKDGQIASDMNAVSCSRPSSMLPGSDCSWIDGY